MSDQINSSSSTTKTKTLPVSAVLAVLLAVAAFLAGSFWTKIQFQGGKSQPTPQPAANAGQPTQAPAVLGAAEQTKLLEGAILIKGKDGASITMVEFSDLQCPACAGAAPAVDQILEDYGDKIKLIFRHFPLTTIHPYARPAALASFCANEQGKFWEYHDKVFENQATLSEDALKQWAKELGLNTTQFNACLDSKKYASQVDTDTALGNQVGVAGTPTFFVNGKRVEWKDRTEGWFNALKRYVETELAS